LQHEYSEIINLMILEIIQLLPIFKNEVFKILIVKDTGFLIDRHCINANFSFSPNLSMRE